MILVLTACQTGERPSLRSEPTQGAAETDLAISAVLDRLSRAEVTTFTAVYSITPSSTGLPTSATVRQSGAQRRVTIGDIDYVIDSSASRTCDNATDTCVDIIDEAQISNLNITHRFWGSSFSDRLKLDASRNLTNAVAHNETIAGQSAVCADVTVVGGTVVYCALDAGILARYFGADVSIELTSYSPQVDPAEITR